jgi:hypothetical protein
LGDFGGFVIMSKERFLLIKAYGGGFWSDIDDLQSKLLLAEITHRQPIVYWGENSLYSVGNCNSFEQYFLPCSNFSIEDLISKKFTYYPYTWNATNVLKEDRTKFKRLYRDIPSFIDSDSNVLVSDVHNHMFEIIPWLEKEHVTYKLLSVDLQLYCKNPILPSNRNEVHKLTRKTINVNRYIINKYIKLRSEISDEIDCFFNTYLKTRPILAVHVRSDNEKCRDVPTMNEINQKYFYEIDNYLKKNPSANIFLLTSNRKILEQYKEIYGSILVFTDCTRDDANPIHHRVFLERKRKGIEIIKDTYLACKCDSFLGTEQSNVSCAINRLKVWEKGNIKLL